MKVTTDVQEVINIMKNNPTRHDITVMWNNGKSAGRVRSLTFFPKTNIVCVKTNNEEVSLLADQISFEVN